MMEVVGRQAQLTVCNRGYAPERGHPKLRARCEVKDRGNKDVLKRRNRLPR